MADATTGPGPEATQAAMVNYSLIANEVVTTDEITRRLREAAAAPARQAEPLGPTGLGPGWH